MLRNALGGGRISDFLEKGLRRYMVPRYYHYEGMGGCTISGKKCYATLEWPLKQGT